MATDKEEQDPYLLLRKLLAQATERMRNEPPLNIPSDGGTILAMGTSPTRRRQESERLAAWQEKIYQQLAPQITLSQMAAELAKNLAGAKFAAAISKAAPTRGAGTAAKVKPETPEEKLARAKELAQTKAGIKEESDIEKKRREVGLEPLGETEGVWSPEERETRSQEMGAIARRVQQINEEMYRRNIEIDKLGGAEKNPKLIEQLNLLGDEKRGLMRRWEDMQAQWATQPKEAPEAAYAKQQRTAELQRVTYGGAIAEQEQKIVDAAEKTRALTEKITTGQLRPPETREEEADRKLAEKLRETLVIQNIYQQRDAQLQIYKVELAKMRTKERLTSEQIKRQDKILDASWKLTQVQIKDREKEEMNPVIDDNKYLRARQRRLDKELSEETDPEKAAGLRQDLQAVTKQLEKNYKTIEKITDKYNKERRKEFDEWKGDYLKEIDEEIKGKEEEEKPSGAGAGGVALPTTEDEEKRTFDISWRLKNWTLTNDPREITLAMRLANRFPILAQKFGATGVGLSGHISDVYEALKTSPLEEDNQCATVLEDMFEEVERGEAKPSPYIEIGKGEYKVSPELERRKIRGEITKEQQEKKLTREMKIEEINRLGASLGLRKYKTFDQWSDRQLDEALEDMQERVEEEFPAAEKAGRLATEMAQKRVEAEDKRLARNLPSGKASAEGADIYTELLERLNLTREEIVQERTKWIRLPEQERYRLLREARREIFEMGR
jgi:hypothetical protein